MGNLEAPITEHPTPKVADKQYIYKQDPKVARALRDAGFTVVSLANNHTLDYDVQGLLDTLVHLDEAGIRWLGGGPDEATARQGLVLDVEGTTIGLLAYMQDYGSYEKDGWFASGELPGAAMMRQEYFTEDIAKMRQQADVVIVHAHYGKNYAEVKRYQERVSRELIDAGADAVNGHHPHVAQGVEIYKGKPILYSLGNYTFGTGGRFEKGQPGYGLVARYNICDDVIRSIELDLIATNNRIVKYQPTIVEAEEARRVMTDLNAPYGTVVRWDGSTAIVDL
jgi:poly-gamma-glutamate synthesis protein (capsule biosynthesis protein)